MNKVQKKRSRSAKKKRNTKAIAQIYGGLSGFPTAKNLVVSTSYSTFGKSKKKRPTTAKSSKKSLGQVSTKNAKKKNKP